MDFINWKTEKQKVLNLVPILDTRSRAKSAPKLSSKYSKDRICKIKQYSNIMMIINRYILAILRTFLNLQKKFIKNSTPKKTSAAATTKFLSKISNRKKISNEHFNLCETEISLDEIIKSINFETNKYPGNDGLTAEF